MENKENHNREETSNSNGRTQPSTSSPQDNSTTGQTMNLNNQNEIQQSGVKVMTCSGEQSINFGNLLKNISTKIKLGYTKFNYIKPETFPNLVLYHEADPNSTQGIGSKPDKDVQCFTLMNKQKIHILKPRNSIYNSISVLGSNNISPESDQITRNTANLNKITPENLTTSGYNLNITAGSSSSTTNSNEMEKSNEDDVLFVKEYKCQSPPTKRRKVTIPETVPRRNPKRQVQMQKLSYNKTGKLGHSSCCETRSISALSPGTSTSTRKSVRGTGAVFSPPAALKPSDYKEWPVSGMHEMPRFNEISNEIEKLALDVTPFKEPDMRACKKRLSGSPAARRRRSKQKKPDSKSFATMAHHNLHHVMSYVESVKEYNKIIGNASNSSQLQSNLRKAGNILSDACILYCVANDLPESEVINYLDSATAKSITSEFTTCAIEGCDPNIMDD